MARLNLASFYRRQSFPTGNSTTVYYAPNSYTRFSPRGEEPPEEEDIQRVMQARVFSPRGPSASRATFSQRLRMGGFGSGDVVSSDPIQLRARMETMIGALERDWAWIKLKIQAKEVAWAYLANVNSYVAGFQTTDNVLRLKRQSINDVLGGQLTLEKWINGVNVARQEIYSYAEYVNGSASVKANLDQLGADLAKTASDYGAAAVDVGKKVATGLAIATPILLVGVAFLLWKVGLPLLHSYLGGRGSYRALRD